MLKERILKAKQDYEAERKRKEKEERDLKKTQKKQALEEVKKAEEQRIAAALKPRETRSRSTANKSVTFNFDSDPKPVEAPKPAAQQIYQPKPVQTKDLNKDLQVPAAEEEGPATVTDKNTDDKTAKKAEKAEKGEKAEKKKTKKEPKKPIDAKPSETKKYRPKTTITEQPKEQPKDEVIVANDEPAPAKRNPKHRPAPTEMDSAAIAELKQTLMNQIIQAEAENAKLAKALQEARDESKQKQHIIDGQQR